VVVLWTVLYTGGEGVSLIMPSAVQSVASVPQAGRPTQQVQPVSSHFEEATGEHCTCDTSVTFDNYTTVAKCKINDGCSCCTRWANTKALTSLAVMSCC